MELGVLVFQKFFKVGPVSQLAEDFDSKSKSCEFDSHSAYFFVDNSDDLWYSRKTE